MKWLMIIALCLSALPVKATDVYWVDKNGNCRVDQNGKPYWWHINDGIDGFFKSEDKQRCLEMLDLFQAYADGIATGKGEKK